MTSCFESRSVSAVMTSGSLPLHVGHLTAESEESMKGGSVTREGNFESYYDYSYLPDNPGHSVHHSCDIPCCTKF